MYQAIAIEQKPLSKIKFRFLGLDSTDNSYGNLFQYPYNHSMGQEFIFGTIDNPDFLSSVRAAFELGNAQQQKFIRSVNDALIQAIPQEKQYLFEDYSFDAYAAEDGSVVIEFITPDLYFSVDIEENPINSSWTFSIKNEYGPRGSNGGFFNEKLTVRYVINSVCRQMIQWMEYGRIS